MRPGDLYFLVIPPPAAVATFLAQHQWLAVIVVAAVLAILGVFVRFCNVLISEIRRKGSWEWRKEREDFLDLHVDREQSRRTRKLEGEQQRREMKRRNPSLWDQLKLFR
jgi:hypothetical protein